MTTWLWVAVVVVGMLVVVPLVFALFLRDVPIGEIRLVSWFHGPTVVYRGPAKAKEIPRLTAGSTVSSRLIKVNLDITDQTADVDGSGNPRPIEVRVSASAFFSIGDDDTLIRIAANRFFSKPEAEQTSTLSDLLSSTVRRAINLLTHDQLFSVKTTPPPPSVDQVDEGAEVAEGGEVAGSGKDEEPLAALIRQSCTRELADLGLVFRAFNVQAVRSEVAEALRRQSAAEAQATADVAVAVQARRSREAQIETDRAISNKERELEETRAANAALIARAAARQHEIQAKTDAERVRVEAEAAAEALRGAQFGLALNEAIRITKIAAAQAEGFRHLGESIREGSESYFRYRLIEMLPQIAPAIAQALADAKLVTGGADGAAGAGANGVSNVVQSILAAQLAARVGALESGHGDGTPPAPLPHPPVQKT